MNKVLTRISMEILDRYGYLESALDYIEKNIVSGKGLQKIANKTGIKKDLLENLHLELAEFSEKQFFVILQEKIEERHSSVSGADAQISASDISVEILNKKAFILMKVICDIVTGGEKEDTLKIEIEIFSKEKIYVR